MISHAFAHELRVIEPSPRGTVVTRVGSAKTRVVGARTGREGEDIEESGRWTADEAKHMPASSNGIKHNRRPR